CAVGRQRAGDRVRDVHQLAAGLDLVDLRTVVARDREPEPVRSEREPPGHAGRDRARAGRADDQHGPGAGDEQLLAVGRERDILYATSCTYGAPIRISGRPRACSGTAGAAPWPARAPPRPPWVSLRT